MALPVVLMTLLSVKSALLETLKNADMVVLFEPTDVAKEPDGIVLVKVPDAELVTTTLSRHEAFGGITVPCAKVTVPKPIAALAVPGLQLVVATEPKLISPGPYVSVKVVDKVALTNAWVLVIVIVSSAVPPSVILGTEKFFETSGLEDVTESLSAAEHTPLLQETSLFVFVTLDGGEITAVFVTCVCPFAVKPLKTNKQTKLTRKNSRRTQ